MVGVVKDTRDARLDQSPLGRFYLLDRHGGSQLIIRTSGAAAALMPVVRRELRRFAPRLTISDIKLMSAIVSDTVAEKRLLMAIVLASSTISLEWRRLGFFGVTAYQVPQRTNEFGVRLPFRATPAKYIRFVSGRSGRWTLSGLARPAKRSSVTLGQSSAHGRPGT